MKKRLDLKSGNTDSGDVELSGERLNDVVTVVGGHGGEIVHGFGSVVGDVFGVELVEDFGDFGLVSGGGNERDGGDDLLLLAVLWHVARHDKVKVRCKVKSKRVQF